MLGGGFLSALAVPLIATWGLPVFTAVTVMATLVLTFLGIRQSATFVTGLGQHQPKHF
jgi:hypothetical protein